MNARPRDTAPRLYVDSLNAMIDKQTVRLSGLNNRVPNAVLWLELFGAALAVGLLGLYLSVLGARTRPGDRGNRSRQLPGPRHVRPRPSDTRPDHGSRNTTARGEGRDEPSSRGAGTALSGSAPGRRRRLVVRRRGGPDGVVAPEGLGVDQCPGHPRLV